MPYENDIDKDNINLNIDNSDLLDYFLKKDEEERKENDLLKEQQEEENKIILEERSNYEDNIISNLENIGNLTSELSVKIDTLNSEIISLHNDFYIFLGLFISAFVVLIFSRSWFSNGL